MSAPTSSSALRAEVCGAGAGPSRGTDGENNVRARRFVRCRTSEALPLCLYCRRVALSQLPPRDALHAWLITQRTDLAVMSPRRTSMTLVQILALAQERIRSGQLPSSLPSKVWTGHGKGQRCVVCNQAINSAERLYEFALPTLSGHSYHCLHFACHEAWIGYQSIA